MDDINSRLQTIAEKEQVDLKIFQFNHEGDIVEEIGRSQEAGVAAILMNPAAYTHTSVAIRDAGAAVDVPTVEVHLSNIYSREEFRHKSLIAPVCHGQISGFGIRSYELGLQAVISLVKSEPE